MSQILKPKEGYKKATLLFKKKVIIPKEWEICKGEDIFELSSGYSPTDLVFSQDGDLLFVKVNDMNAQENLKKVINSKNKFLQKDNSQIVLANKNTIIFPKRGMAIHKNKVRILSKKGTVDPNVMILQCNSKINIDYFLYFLNYLKLKYLSESAGIPQLNNKDLYPRNFIKPSLQEQQKIATILSNIDNLIDNTHKIVDQTKLLKKGLMQKLLVKGIDHKKFKKIKWLFGKTIEIPKDWEITRHGNVCEFINGYAYSQTEISDTGYPIIRIQNLTGGTKYVHSNVKLPEKQFAEDGDLLYAWSATFSPFIWHGEKSAFHYHQWKVIPNEKSDKMFLFYHFERVTPTIKNMGHSGLGMFHMTKNGMERFLFFKPPLQEQQKIATILSNIDSQIQSQIQYKEKLERLKKSLMQKLLTGEVRVIV